jgi:uncharacterized damage-inducible protein DinB
VSIIDALLPEYDHEMGLTRRLLERVPDEDFAWKPHDRSMSLGALVTHLANIPTWTEAIADRPEFDMASVPPDATPPVPTSRKELLTRFDENVADARMRIAGKSDGELLAMWTFRKNGQVVFVMPRLAALRGFLMNHTIHHRGQLSVYLRLKNVPLPSIYGPTADET